MGKKDEYRFNLRFDETDEMHRLVVKYLNSCGHNKAKYIVRAFLAYWKMSGKSLLSYVFPEIDAEQLLPEAKQENDKKTAVVAKASDAENDNGTDADVCFQISDQNFVMLFKPFLFIISKSFKSFCRKISFIQIIYIKRFILFYPSHCTIQVFFQIRTLFIDHEIVVRITDHSNS